MYELVTNFASVQLSYDGRSYEIRRIAIFHNPDYVKCIKVKQLSCYDECRIWCDLNAFKILSEKQLNNQAYKIACKLHPL